jgi:glycine oxidase
MSNIAIIGAGICGLSIGWRLAAAGRRVTLFDRAKAGQGATWAAGGMLAPQVEAEPGEEVLLPLLLESRASWAAFARELEAATGLGVDHRTEGTLVVALDRDDEERLAFQHRYQREQGLAVEWLNGAEARRLEPHLSRRVIAALFSPLDHQVDNRKVATALKAAFLAAGGELREDCAVDAVLTRGERVRGVRTGEESVIADWVVLAAGAWSRNIAGLPDSVRPPIRPLKGQMVALQMPAAAPLLRHVVWIPDGYLIPRYDGRLLIGGTVEEMGFDTQLTAGGLFEVLRGAWEALPAVYDLPVLETWAGLRPASRDDAPILGPTAVEGLVMATGHHRNGILLAPITADAISRVILKGEVPPAIAPFSLDRFKPGTAGPQRRAAP